MLLECCCAPAHDCPLGNTITVTVKDCAGVLAGGVGVTVTGPGGFTASGTTHTSLLTGGIGVFSFTWFDFGAYVITSTVGGYTSSVTVTTSSCTNYTATLCVGGAKVCVTTGGGCDGALSGLTVTLTQGGSTVASGSPVSNSFCACVPAGILTTVTVTTTTARFDAGTTTLTPTACSTNTVTCSPTVSSGYHCLCSAAGCVMPVKDTLFLTESKLGMSATLTYDFGLAYWVGTTSYAFPGCGGTCPGDTTTVTFKFGGLPGHGAGFCGIEQDYTPSTDAVLARSGCPGTDAGGSVVPLAAGMTVGACPPSFSASASANYAGLASQSLYECSGLPTSTTWTVTE